MSALQPTPVILPVVYRCKQCQRAIRSRRNREFCDRRCRSAYFNKQRYFTPRRSSPVACATQSPTLLDLAWAAGIFEGEGHARYGEHTLRLCVVQKDDWLLRRLRALFGGSVYRHSGRCSAWYLSGSRARGFALTIFTFLSPRRRQQIQGAFHRDRSRLVA